MPPSRVRRLRRIESETRAGYSAEWPVLTALGLDPAKPRPGVSAERTVTGKQIADAADVADKLVREQATRADRAEQDLDVAREQRDRALLLLRRLADDFYSPGMTDRDKLRVIYEAGHQLAQEVGVLALDRDVRAALAGVLADGPALEAAVAAALDAAVIAPLPGPNTPRQDAIAGSIARGAR